jgi:hypothetical protein
VAIGVGACTKMVAPYVLLVLALYELLSWLAAREGALRRIGRLVACVGATGAVLIGLLAALDVVAPPYDNAAARLVKGGPFDHLAHMFSYAAHQTSPNGPQGIASYPWQWLIDVKSITYLNINNGRPAPGLMQTRPNVHFLGLISPPILVAGLLGLVLALWALGRAGVVRRRPARRPRGSAEPQTGLAGLAGLALAWFLGTWLPFVALSLFYQRTSYLYYMVIVMPGLYVSAAALAARLWHWRWLAPVWMVGVLVAVVLSYPLTPL